MWVWLSSLVFQGWHERLELLSLHREYHTSRAHSESHSIQSLKFGWNDSGQTTAGLDPQMEVMFSASVYYSFVHIFFPRFHVMNATKMSYLCKKSQAL